MASKKKKKTPNLCSCCLEIHSTLVLSLKFVEQRQRITLLFKSKGIQQIFSEYDILNGRHFDK